MSQDDEGLAKTSKRISLLSSEAEWQSFNNTEEKNYVFCPRQNFRDEKNIIIHTKLVTRGKHVW